MQHSVRDPAVLDLQNVKMPRAGDRDMMGPWVTLYEDCPLWMRITDYSINQFHEHVHAPVQRDRRVPKHKRKHHYWTQEDRQYIYDKVIWGDVTMRECAATMGVSYHALKGAWGRLREAIQDGMYPEWTLPKGVTRRPIMKFPAKRWTEENREYIYQRHIWGPVTRREAAAHLGVSSMAIKSFIMYLRTDVRRGRYPGWRMPTKEEQLELTAQKWRSWQGIQMTENMGERWT